MQSMGTWPHYKFAVLHNGWFPKRKRGTARLVAPLRGALPNFWALTVRAYKLQVLTAGMLPPPLGRPAPQRGATSSQSELTITSATAVVFASFPMASL